MARVVVIPLKRHDVEVRADVRRVALDDVALPVPYTIDLLRHELHDEDGRPLLVDLHGDDLDFFAVRDLGIIINQAFLLPQPNLVGQSGEQAFAQPRLEFYGVAPDERVDELGAQLSLTPSLHTSRLKFGSSRRSSLVAAAVSVSAVTASTIDEA